MIAAYRYEKVMVVASWYLGTSSHLQQVLVQLLV